jgi:hypothetical protein
MLRVVAIGAIVAGCYQPAAVDGARCGPGGACPSDQRCDPATDRCTANPSTPDAPDIDDAPVLDAPDGPASGFVDDFDRPDADALGNGWIEKVSPTFRITGGEVTRIDTMDSSYRDNMVYRPASEDIRDVEISIRVRFSQTPPRFAQIFVRADSATIATPDSYRGYLFYVDGVVDNEVVLGRQIGTPFVVTLERIVLSEPINTTDRYRMVLRAVGADPVLLHARLEKFVPGGEVVLGETTLSDADPLQLTAPGTVGFAGDELAAYVYDEFRSDRR